MKFWKNYRFLIGILFFSAILHVNIISNKSFSVFLISTIATDNQEDPKTWIKTIDMPGGGSKTVYDVIATSDGNIAITGCTNLDLFVLTVEYSSARDVQSDAYASR